MSKTTLIYGLVAALGWIPVASHAGMSFYNLEFDLPDGWKSKSSELAISFAGNSPVAGEKAFALKLGKPINVTPDGKWFEIVVSELTSQGLVAGINRQVYATPAGYTVYSQDFDRAANVDSFSRVMAFSNGRQASIILVATLDPRIPAGVEKSIAGFLNKMHFVPICADEHVEKRLNGSWSFFTGGAEYGHTISWTFRPNGRFHTNSQTSVMVSGNHSPYTPSAVSATGYSSSGQDGCYSIHDNTLNLRYDNGVTKALPIEISGSTGGDPQKFVTIGRQLLSR